MHVCTWVCLVQQAASKPAPMEMVSASSCNECCVHMCVSIIWGCLERDYAQAFTTHSVLGFSFQQLTQHAALNITAPHHLSSKPRTIPPTQAAPAAAKAEPKEEKPAGGGLFGFLGLGAKPKQVDEEPAKAPQRAKVCA